MSWRLVQGRWSVALFLATYRIPLRLNFTGCLPNTDNVDLGNILSLAFSPDGRRLATCGIDGTVRLWSTNNQEMFTLRGHSSLVFKVAFSPDGKILASASVDRTVRLWRAVDFR